MKTAKFEDLYQFQFVSEPAVSPDGKYVAWVVNTADKEKNTYISQLWMADVETKEKIQMTAGYKVQGIFWVDDHTIAFRSDKGGKDLKSSYFTISISGREAEFWFDYGEKILSMQYLKEDTYLIHYNHVCVQDDLTGGELSVFEELPYWSNGKGVVSRKRNALAIYNVKTKESQMITGTYVDVLGYDCSKDGNLIVFACREFQDVQQKTSGLRLYDVEKESTQIICDQESALIDQPAILEGDFGKKIFYTAKTFEFVGRNPGYMLYDLNSKEKKQAAFLDAMISNTVGTDSAYGSVHLSCKTDEAFYFVNTGRKGSRIKALYPDCNVKEITPLHGAVLSFDIKNDVIAMCKMEPNKLAEIFVIKDGVTAQISDHNAAYFEETKIQTQEYFTWKNKAGVDMDGYIIYPTDYDPAKKYAGILEIHGGPKVSFADLYHHEMQCLATEGFFVFYSNPRGSDGRGEEFANITERLGKDDYEDLMEFVDEVIKRCPALNADKIGICGGSYGGFMCNWMIGHTKRFAAAASQRGISNYITKGLCTDIGYYHNFAQLGATPWTDFKKVWENSPVSKGFEAVTPTLFIQSDEDYRCFMSGAFQMFSALKHNGTDARLVLFHGENHELSRSGKPKNRIRRLEEISNWMIEKLTK